MNPPSRPEERRDDGDRWFTIEQAGDYTGLAVRTLRNFLSDAAHPLPHHRIVAAGKVRGLLRFRRSEIDGWLGSFTPDAGADPSDGPDQETRSWIRGLAKK